MASALSRRPSSPALRSLCLLLCAPTEALRTPPLPSAARENPSLLVRLPEARSPADELMGKPARAIIPGLGSMLRELRFPTPPRAEEGHVSLHPSPASRTEREGRSTGGRELRLSLHGKQHTLLCGVSSQLEATLEDGGVFLSLNAHADKHLHKVGLGKLTCERFLAASRIKRWWMGPTHGTCGGEVPSETQFLLLQLADDAYAVLLPLVDGDMRTCLRAGKGDELLAEVQSGCPDVRAKRVENVMYVGVGSSPFELLRGAFDAVSRRLKTFEVVHRKPTPAGKHYPHPFRCHSVIARACQVCLLVQISTCSAGAHGTPSTSPSVPLASARASLLSTMGARLRECWSSTTDGKQ